MADKKETKTLERIYNVPLRKEFQKAPNWKRTGKAVVALREFIAKNMKSDNVKLGKEVNDALWQNGIRNPPHHLKVTVTKDEKGEVKVGLFGFKKKDEKKASKKETKIAKKEEPKAVPETTTKTESNKEENLSIKSEKKTVTK